jgi:hypothetical protein
MYSLTGPTGPVEGPPVSMRVERQVRPHCVVQAVPCVWRQSYPYTLKHNVLATMMSKLPAHQHARLAGTDYDGLDAFHV